MKDIVQILILATLVTATSGGGAAAASKCSVIGYWTDKFGDDATFHSDKAGVATDSNLCAGRYKLKVLSLNAQHFRVFATPAMTSCPTFRASLVFQGSCSVAAGTVIVAGKGTYHDTWTNSGAPLRHTPTASASLVDGLK